MCDVEGAIDGEDVWCLVCGVDGECVCMVYMTWMVEMYGVWIG